MPTTIKTQKRIVLKDNTIIPPGTVMEWICQSAKMPDSVGTFDYKGRSLKLRYTSVFKAPSIATLERWSDDGISRDVIHGENIEPDGYTSDGSPSWHLALGVI